MKRLLMCFFAICFYGAAQAQNNVGIGTPTPNASSVLELYSTTQGFLPPRTHVGLIAAPVTGLVIYDIDTGCYVFYTGARWQNLCSPSLPNQSFDYNDTVYINTNGTISIVDSNGTHILTTPQAVWLTTGNIGTTAGTNFVGTTDAQDLVVKANNTEIMRASQANDNVGIGTPTPNAAALLDLSSASKGFLAPRSTVAMVTTPVAGLVIYDTDSLCYVLYNGTHWLNLCNPVLPPQHLGFNDSIYFGPTGTITVVDSDGGHDVTSPQAAWLTSGNAGTTAGTNFIGTTDAQDLVVKSNNGEVMRATTAGAVGINTPAPNATSILDITSTTKGVLFPAMSQAQRDAIGGGNPAVGLVIYNTDINVHQSWNGTCWVNIGQTVCSFTYAISQSHTTDCLFKSNFNSVSDTITVSLVSGTPSPVILSAAGVPAGVLVNFSNNYLTPTQTSIMTLTALPSAPDGTYTITILAASGSTIQTLTYTLTVYDFAVTLSPSSSTVTLAAAQAGGTIATSTLTIGNPSACNTNAGNATLTYAITPSNPGLSVSFGNPSLPVPGSTTLTITSTCALQGTYQITVTSVVGVSTSTAVYTLTILGPAPIHISASTQNVNLFTLAGQPSCPVVDTFYVDAGVIVGSNSTANTAPGAAMETGVFASGSHIVIINNGTIVGAGGIGGNQTGYGYLGSCAGIGDGGNGGNAIDIGMANVVVDNHGVIGGGGGGGAAGADLSVTPCTLDARGGSGGGGGAGSIPGAGGNNGGGSEPGNAGTAGTLTTGGTGGAETTWGPCFLSFGSQYHNGNGGNGGALGQAGGAGGTSNFAGSTGVCGAGAPGSAGCPITAHGNAFTFNGTAVLGTVCP